MEKNPQRNPDKVFITTPIYYTNDRPHVGHAYSTIAADTLARYWRDKIGSDNVLFSTGTDENSKKTIEAAHDAQKSVENYTDEMADIWENTWKQLGIEYDDFIRTSEDRHTKAAQHFIQRIYESGDVSKGSYKGPYCFRCEAFYKEEELVEGGEGEQNCCPIHKKPIEIVSEDNYFFDLPKYAQQVRHAITSGELEVLPLTRQNEVLSFIDQGLEKISISRANQEIGIPLPFDESQRTYVWVEALINYLTVAGYPNEGYEQWWNGVTHIVGKDIIKFHCIIWPALLLSAGLTVPKRVFAHGFFTINGEKISKSLGNTIDPVVLTEQYGVDALRYYLLREIPFGADGNFSSERFKDVYNSELVNGIGNLLQRTTKMVSAYKEGAYTPYVQRNGLIEKFGPVLEALQFNQYIDDVTYSAEFSLSASPERALQTFIATKRMLKHENYDKILELSEPWKLYKESPDEVKVWLDFLVADLKIVFESLKYILPVASGKALRTLGEERIQLSDNVLFPRIETEEAGE